MNKKKKILFIMSRLPFPAVSGRKNSLFHYCKILSEELGSYLIVAAFLECEDKAGLLNFYQNEHNNFKIYGERFSDSDQVRYIQLLRFF